jgi:hypothetical protein
VLFDEALVRAHRLRRDAKHLQPKGLDPVAIVSVRAKLLRAHRCEVARVEGEDDALAAVLGEPVGASAGAGEREVRGRAADPELGHR